jgi:hypothetical protein
LLPDLKTGVFSNDREARRNSDPEFLQRITINYIRHQHSEYDEQLEHIFGKVGTAEAYLALNRKIADAIEEKYPVLREACADHMAMKADLEAMRRAYLKKPLK